MKAIYKVAIISVSILLLLGVGTFAVYATRPQLVAVTPAVIEQVSPPTVNELLTLVNAERAKVNVAPLAIDERLNKSAQQKSDDMATNNYFAHVDKNGRHGYDIAHEYAPDICMNPSENLRLNGDINSSSAVVDGWMSSPAHRAALLDQKITYTGFGISGEYITEHFC